MVVISEISERTFYNFPIYLFTLFSAQEFIVRISGDFQGQREH